MSEMSPKGAVATVIATILVAARSLAEPGTTVPLYKCFADAEAIIAEAEARYGTIPTDAG